MSKVSIIIPARNELFLQKTAADLLENGGDVEVIAVLDGYWPNPPLREDKRLVVLHRGKAQGMRAAINGAAEIATGEWLMKCDAHCMFDKGYDEILQADCADNWMVIPRRYSLDAEQWALKNKEPIDYHYYFYPYAHPEDLGLHARPWYERGRERREFEVDEELTTQGSCWFMHRSLWERVGPLQEEGYETFMGEPQELGFKVQLGPWEGRMMVNKRTWYAHLHKGKQYGRMYYMSNEERKRGNAYSFDYWWNNRWPERVHDLEWLIDRWMPLPSWPENWKELKNAH
jgi:glycosyltransferase involved in cell wall biosynthesis